MNALWALITALQPTLPQQAPVYVQVSPSVLRRSGTFQYKSEEEGYEILLCIQQPPRVTLKCLVRTPADMLVMIEAVASEQGT